MSMPWVTIRDTYQRNTIIRGLAAFARDDADAPPVQAMKWALERYDHLKSVGWGSLWSDEIRWLDRQAVIHMALGLL